MDLPDGKQSGLVHATKVLADIKEIDFCYFKDTDVVRHTLVRKIINAYERYEK
ncbi:MAG: PhoH family protein [Clostridiales Family XIII bacterium]|nr:PhoH family protein [Clostridiales Family XIII bacterium]